MKLRPYQQDVFDKLITWFEKNQEGHPIVSASVGAGKSVLIAYLCKWALETFPGERILMVVASKELCEQDYDKLMRVWPDAPVGILSASIGGRRTEDDIVFGTIGTVFRQAHNLGKRSLVIVDEVHNVNPSNAGMYRDTFKALQMYNPDLRIVGMTGTPFRGNGVWLTDGEDPIFTDVAAHIGMTELLEQGYLAPLVLTKVEQLITADGTRTSGDDYVVSELERLADREDVTRRAVDSIIEHGQERKGWLIYCVTVKHAEHVLDEVLSRGVAAALITGTTPKRERENILKRFQAGELRCIVNVVVLTVGFDAPHVDLIALLRPTKSKVLYVQICGRGMRCLGQNMEESITKGKEDCLWLDFSDTTLSQGPVNLIKGRKKRANSPDMNGVMPAKQCPECSALNDIGAKHCDACGFEFPTPDIKVAARASQAPIIARQKVYAPTIYPISSVTYSVHNKDGKPPSMMASYYSGLRVVAREWLCFEHGGMAAVKAIDWFNKRMTGNSTAIPRQLQTSTAIAIANQGGLKRPNFIGVDERNKFPEITGYYMRDPRLTEEQKVA